VRASVALVRIAPVRGSFLVKQLRGDGRIAVVELLRVRSTRLICASRLPGDHSDRDGDQQLPHSSLLQL
jgi:hypothetical protein